MEVHADAFAAGEQVLLVDDLIATGGTALAAVKLIEKLGAKPAGASFIVDLPELGGLAKLRALGIHADALCSFEGH
jgi:adenine phosphoribosyltransferase